MASVSMDNMQGTSWTTFDICYAICNVQQEKVEEEEEAAEEVPAVVRSH